MNSRFPPLCDETAGSWLKPGGKFDQSWDRFEARAGQVEMAAAVEQALASESVLFCEAGTGTGKTLAYLLAAIQSGRRVVVSTATRALQDQIWSHDIPLVERILARPVSAMVMKGLSNYVCLRRAHAALVNPSLPNRNSLEVIDAWRHETSVGELSELSALAESDPALGLVHSSSDTRVGARCAFHDRCFVTQMKRRAEAAQLIIVNHHLFFADLALRGPHPGRVIPDYDAVILDEAHQVEDIAGLFFGVRVSQQRLRMLSKDAATLFSNANAKSNLTGQLERAEQALFERLAEAAANGNRTRLHRESWSGATYQAYLDVDGVLEGLAQAAEVARRSASLDDEPATSDGLESVARRAQDLRDSLAAIVEDDHRQVTWLDISSHGHALSSSPVDLAPVLNERLFRRVPSVVLTSATLATPPVGPRVHVGDAFTQLDNERPALASSRFGYYRTRLGATDTDLDVREVIVAASADARQMTESIVSTSSFATKVSVVSGGSTRTESVRSALEVVSADVDVVLVHDAVRPFIRADQIDQVRRVAFETGAASLAIPVANTLRRAQNGVFTEQVDRDGAYSVQTPQAFRRELLLESYEALSNDAQVTDDAAVVIERGHQVHIVPGSILNMKITTEDDWRVASLLWPVWQSVISEET